jgi:hypothetical protein
MSKNEDEKSARSTEKLILCLSKELLYNVEPFLCRVNHRKVTSTGDLLELGVNAVLRKVLAEGLEHAGKSAVPLSGDEEDLLLLELVGETRVDVVALKSGGTGSETLDGSTANLVVDERLLLAALVERARRSLREPAGNGRIGESVEVAVLAGESDAVVPRLCIGGGGGSLGVAGDELGEEGGVVVSEGERGGAALRDTDDGVDGSGDGELCEDGRNVAGEYFETARRRRNRRLGVEESVSVRRRSDRTVVGARRGGGKQGESEKAHLAVSALVVGEKVVRLAQSGKNKVPHLLVRHKRVDEDEPRRILRSLRNLDMNLHSRLDLDVVLTLLGLRKRHALLAEVSDVKGDEKAGNHVVGRNDGGRFEKLLVVLQVLLELIDARLRNDDVVGRGVGEAKGGGLVGGKGSVKVADNGELLSGETGIGADVSVVCRKSRQCGFCRSLSRVGRRKTKEKGDERIHSKAAELRAATRRIYGAYCRQ